ncbi:WecB/TagA/CpsF family glycosyltransferase [Deminuibacter soli]|uniref:Glycosyltransferase n=1 Tax=Deminuibacter soli TaxID=2291815 RepID=A0A3E1NFA5_9BACT|nr:WecB/TagA/CpsF family glycosyltransferase [Deminuibacter soli]RFM26649.1 glycosyltransferase [Deminuibacter soli]
MVNVLGVPLYTSDIPTFTKAIIDDILQGKPRTTRLVSATGAHGIVLANQHRAFMETLHHFHTNLPDGMPGVWIGRAKGHKQMRRCYGPDVFLSVIEATAQTGIKHFFCGGKEGVANELKNVCNIKLKNDYIVGTFCPPFRDMTEEELIDLADLIHCSQADIVWIGLSTPKQEYFARRLQKYIRVHAVFTVGAAFDFHTGNVKQAPAWIQKAGMEWFFRLTMEPSRLYKRYFTVVPLFLYMNLKELLGIKSSKHSL